jgi:hypothetical protein
MSTENEVYVNPKLCARAGCNHHEDFHSLQYDGYRGQCRLCDQCRWFLVPVMKQDQPEQMASSLPAESDLVAQLRKLTERVEALEDENRKPVYLELRRLS